MKTAQSPKRGRGGEERKYNIYIISDETLYL
jgi:hypothetical protein